MLYREIIAVCSQIHTKHTNTLCGQNVEYFSFKPGGTYSDHWGLQKVNCVFNFSVQIFLQSLFVCDKYFNEMLFNGARLLVECPRILSVFNQNFCTSTNCT